MINPRATPALYRLHDWMIEEALPVWLDAGYDDERGQFVEALTAEGAPDQTGRLRVRSAARQIHVYADASRFGVAPPGALDKAIRAFESLHRDAWLGAGSPGYAHAIDARDGSVLVPLRDLYDHACVLLAAASLYRVTGEARWLDAADKVMAVLDGVLAAEGGGWAENDAGTLPRRQNPHMHLFEALLVLVEAAGREPDRAHLAHIHALLHERFLDGSGLLREFFGPRWELDARYGSDGLYPGHMPEWVWLLDAYSRVAPVDVEPLARQLLASARATGMRPDNAHFLLNEADASGAPRKTTRRLWSQAEAIKAGVVMARRAVDQSTDAAADDSADGPLRGAERIAARLFETYLTDTPPGTWRDAFDLEGRAIPGTIPSSSNYHLWTAVVEIHRCRLE